MKLPFVGTIGRFFNQAPAAPGAATSTTSTTSPTGATGGYSASGPPQTLTEFQAKYGKPPYLPGEFWGGRFYGQLSAPISPKMIQAVAKRIGSILPPEDKAQLAKNFAQEKALDERMGALGFYASTAIWQKKNEEAQAAIKAGQSVVIPTKQQITESISAERGAIHGIFREISASNHAILKTAVERFGKISREFVVERDAQERAEFLELHGEGPQFVPSQYLQGLCYLALVTAAAPIRNFEICGHLRAPDPSAPLIDLWIKATPTPIAQSQAPAPNGQAALDLAQQRAAEAQAAASKAHAEALAEKNKLVADFKAKLAADAEEKELADLAKEQSAAAHKVELQAKLAAKTQPTDAGDKA
ncbi:MAG: hypothetical protein ABSF51_12725 [Verrucomicrobiota bacterium]|jgi:hypothetical protein